MVVRIERLIAPDLAGLSPQAAFLRGCVNGRSRLLALAGEHYEIARRALRLATNDWSRGPESLVIAESVLALAYANLTGMRDELARGYPDVALADADVRLRAHVAKIEAWR